MKLVIKLRSGREWAPGKVDVPASGTVADLQKKVHELSLQMRGAGDKRQKELYPSRQRFTLPAAAPGAKPVVLAAGKKLSDYGLKDGSEVTFKDLGTQIGYSTVFFWEYFGPMVIYPLFYVLAPQIYGEPNQVMHPVQGLAAAYWAGHYAKRILETWFVHAFSHGTMPIFNLYRNCSYYWGFAAMVGYFINHPRYTPPSLALSQYALCAALVCQLGNFYSHVILTNLRKDGSKEYKIPKGFTFEICTCSNYMWEIYGWVCFNVATQSLMGCVFCFCGAYQMALWAAAKHARLRRTFDGKEGRAKYPRRFKMLPPVF